MSSEMIKVDSSTIDSIGYSAVHSELIVKFLSGKVYVYHSVPEEVALDGFNAVSVGKWHGTKLRGFYGYREVNISANLCDNCENRSCFPECNERLFAMNTLAGADNIVYCEDYCQVQGLSDV